MKATILSVFILFLSSLGFSGQTSQPIAYYGAEFYQDLANGAKDDALIFRLQNILHSYHKLVPGGYDQILNNCSGAGCYNHVLLGYDRARIWMMGVYYLVQNNGQYALPDFYCGDYKTAEDFPDNPPGPNRIPSGNILNTEHTWPQSKFTGRFNRELQKSDLHHLFPTDSQMNSARGNNDFGDVVTESKKLKCPVSHTGRSASGSGEVFEPPPAHKGNVARALFYFSVQYSIRMSRAQEITLRKWNKDDAVDTEEMNRNNEIMKVQGNRNPFIDYPDLVDRISSFSN